jgi:hypothetical protein
MKGYQPRNNFIKPENCDLLADSHSILSRQENYLSPIIQCAQGQWR